MKGKCTQHPLAKYRYWESNLVQTQSCDAVSDTWLENWGKLITSSSLLTRAKLHMTGQRLANGNLDKSTHTKLCICSAKPARFKHDKPSSHSKPWDGGHFSVAWFRCTCTQCWLADSIAAPYFISGIEWVSDFAPHQFRSLPAPSFAGCIGGQSCKQSEFKQTLCRFEAQGSTLLATLLATRIFDCSDWGKSSSPVLFSAQPIFFAMASALIFLQPKENAGLETELHSSSLYNGYTPVQTREKS